MRSSVSAGSCRSPRGGGACAGGPAPTSPAVMASAMAPWARETSTAAMARSSSVTSSTWWMRIRRSRTSSTSSSARLPANAGDHRVEVVAPVGELGDVEALLVVEGVVQLGLGRVAVGPGDGQVDQGQLDPDAQFDEVGHRDVAAGEVDGDDVAHAAHAGGADEQAAAGAAPHGGDLMVLQQAERLAEDRPAGAVASRSASVCEPRSVPGGRSSATTSCRMARATSSARLLLTPPPRATLRGRTWRDSLRFCRKADSASRWRRIRRLAASASWSSTASMMRACASRDADSVPSPSVTAAATEVEEGDPVEDVDEELEGGVAGDGGQAGVQGAVVAHLGLLQRAQTGGVFLGQPFGGQLGCDHLQDDARFEDLVEAGVGPVQVQHRGVDDGVHRRLGDDQPAAGPPSHGGHLLVLDQAHRLAEDGPAHPVALDQLGLRAQHLAHRPAPVDHVGEDAPRHGGRQRRLGLGRQSATSCDAAGTRAVEGVAAIKNRLYSIGCHEP